MKKPFLSKWILPTFFPNPYQQIAVNDNLLQKAKLNVINSKGIQSIFSVSDKIKFKVKGEYRFQTGKIVGLGKDFLLIRDRKTLKKVYIQQVNYIGKRLAGLLKFSKILFINQQNKLFIQ